MSKPRIKINIFWIYGLLALAIIGWNIMSDNGTTKKTTWAVVQDSMLKKGEVKKVIVVNDKDVEVYLTKNATENYKKKKEYEGLSQQGPQFSFRIGDLKTFQDEFKTTNSTLKTQYQAAIDFESRESMWGGFFLTTVLPIAALIILWIFIMRRMSGGSGGGGGGGVFNVGKAKAQVFDKENSVNISFKDVAGLAEAKVEVMEIVDFLKNPKKYSDLGGKIPKGALLVGPPGTGKTLLAKAVAGEASVPFFSISGSDFVEMFVGVGASRVRDLFRQAKEKAPCIVFIDEIDAIGRARSKNAGFSSNDERENTLNQLLTEMDGFGTNAGVIILAATNRVDILDKALLRAGRFDRQINVELPDITEREEIFKVHLAKIKLEPDFDIDFLSKQTPGFSGADIANVCNEAALIAARYNKKHVEKQDFLDAIDRIIGGLERKNKVITKNEKRTIAYHEAGHATVSWLLEHANPLIKVTIIPRGRALGAAWYTPEERQITTREQLLHEMSSLLGGRVSEQINFGAVSTGALNDLERVTKMAYAMVAYYGMSGNVGNLSYYDSSGVDSFTKPYSEETAREIDNEVKALINEAYVQAEGILREHKDGLTKLAELLLEKEVVFAEDLATIFGARQKTEREIEAEEAKIEKEVKAATAVAEVKETGTATETEIATATETTPDTTQPNAN